MPGFVITQQDDEGEDDDEAVEFEAEGTISNLMGTCPDTTFNVNGTLVTTDINTEYENGTCTDLANGVQVKVEGVTQANGTNLARLCCIRGHVHLIKLPLVFSRLDPFPQWWYKSGKGNRMRRS